MACKGCKREYVWVRSKGHTRDNCNTCIQRRRRELIRSKIREYVGGFHCIRCGYDKCEAAVVFHHTIPKEKSFSIRSCYGHSWKRIKEEIDKCEMLCANCHAEEHWL